MTKDKKAILIALALGDGYISKFNCLEIQHSQNQLEYVKWKQKLLESLCGGRKTVLYFRERLDSRTGKVYKQVATHKQHKYFRVIRNWLYRPDKTYSTYILNKLTPEAIAIWYMDDGGISGRTSKKTGKISSIQVSLYTYCSEAEAKLVQTYFNTVWQIDFAIYGHRNNKYYLCANTKNGNKFLDLVRPFIIPSMLYKVNCSPRMPSP